MAIREASVNPPAIFKERQQEALAAKADRGEFRTCISFVLVFNR